MPRTATVLFDEQTNGAYYLAFDLLLARAPYTGGGGIHTDDARVVEHDESDLELATRYAAIKVALLQAQFGGTDAWDSAIEDARRHAQGLAAEAGLASPPPLDQTEIRRVELG